MRTHYIHWLLVVVGILFYTLTYGQESFQWQPLFKQAQTQQLAQHAYWLRLLKYHHPGESLGQWSLRSDVTNDAFFLSKDGQTNPERELQATLQAFFMPLKTNEDPNQHAQCRFVARYHWLKSQLDFSNTSMPPFNCPLFKRWANLDHVTSISLVFASAYLGNPASIYGHILLKVNSEDNVFGHPLLSPTFNFGATADPSDNPITYAFKGLFGGYNGRLSDERFYNYNHIYGETELRDLWEYELNFDEQQLHKIIYHAWELLQGIDFDYYFFLDNCSYRMAELLEMAWDDVEINSSSLMFVSIPINVFHRLTEITNNEKPLVKKIILIPSRQRRLQKKIQSLNVIQKNWFIKLIEDFSSIQSEAFSQIPRSHQAAILDTVIDYNQYQIAEDQEALTPKQKQQLLLTRSKLPILPSPTNEFKSLQPPTEGTKPVRFRVAAVTNSVLKNSIELGAWTSFHDLIGREEGHLSNTQLTTLDLRIRINQDRVYFQELEMFHLKSHELTPAGSPLSSGWSWQARGAIEPRDLKCKDCQYLKFRGGVGKSISLFSEGNSYLATLLNLFLQTTEELEETYSAGITPSLNLVVTPTNIWKFELEWFYFDSLFGQEVLENKATWNHRFTLDKNWDARLEMEHHQATEISLGLSYYW